MFRRQLFKAVSAVLAGGSMMRSDDLVPALKKPDAGNAVGFRQGVIIAWNRDTAENIVKVGDSFLENLPILNTSEASILDTGDVVSILTAGPTWGIMGRFTIPGTAEAASALSAIRTQSQEVPTFEETTSTTFVDLDTHGPQVTIAVPPSGRLLVTLSANMGCSPTASAAGSVAGSTMSYEMSGANSAAADDVNSLQLYATLSSGTPSGDTHSVGVGGHTSRSILLSGLNPGLTTFTAKYACLFSGTTSAFYARNITVIAL